MKDAREAVGRDASSRTRISATRNSTSSTWRRGRRARLTSGKFVVGSFDWSPDGTPDSLRSSRHERCRQTAARPTSRVVEVATGARTAAGRAGRVPTPTRAGRLTAHAVAFVSAMAKPFYFYQNSVIAVVTPGQRRVQQPHRRVRRRSRRSSIGRRPASSSRRRSAPARALFTLDPATRRFDGMQAVATMDRHAVSRLDADGSRVAFVGAGPAEFADVYVAPVQRPCRPRRRVSDTGAQIASWPRAHARGDSLEEPGRRRDRRRAAQAGQTSRPGGAIRCWS